MAGYLARGWALVQLHDVASGACSCGNRDPEHTRRQGGKHPVHANWTTAPITSLPMAEAMWSARPAANVGVVTGAVSDMWVLDVDPDNGGHERLAELEREHKPLPLAGWRARTGSGGVHLGWALPPDFEPGGSRGRLPVGLDVRGRGGQIVVAPSVSGKGAYTVERDEALTPAPGWLLDLIRPKPYSAPALPATGGAYGYGPGQGDVALSGALERGAAYARAAVGALLGELARAPEGMRNETAFRVACRLVELGNAAWSGLDGPALYGGYLGACSTAHASGGSGFPEAEAVDVWGKGWRHVAGRAAELPPSVMGGEVIGYAPPLPPAAPPFAPAPPVGHPASPSGGPGAGAATAELPVPLDAAGALLARMLTTSQLLALPDPMPLVNGLLDCDTSAWMIGKPGSYKSFVSLSIAASVARGEAWMGRATRRGRVVYIVAEGARGMRLRTMAWQATYGVIPDELLFLPEPVQAKDVGAWSTLVEACRRVGPALVVIDTQSRCALGLSENDNSEMMTFVSAVDAIRRATGACVLVVHHQGRTGNDSRGASSIDGAQDTELRVERVGDLRVKIHLDKQKDASDAEGVELSLRVVDQGVSMATGRDLSSLVVVEGAEGSGAEPEGPLHEARARGLYATIRDLFNLGDGGTKSEVRAAFLGHSSMTALREAPPNTRAQVWRRAWNELVDRGLIASQGGRFKVIILADQSQDGTLTRNVGDAMRYPSDGWVIWQGAPEQRGP